MIAGDLVLPFPPPPPVTASTSAAAAAATTPGSDGKSIEAFFVPVEEGMSSYCPRDLRGGGEGSGAAGAAGVGGGGGDVAAEAMQARLEREKDLQAFELLGMVIGANLGWNKVNGDGGRRRYRWRWRESSLKLLRSRGRGASLLYFVFLVQLFLVFLCCIFFLPNHRKYKKNDENSARLGTNIVAPLTRDVTVAGGDVCRGYSHLVQEHRILRLSQFPAGLGRRLSVCLSVFPSASS